MINNIVRKKKVELRDEQGFTLIELMVVVLIIGILMAIAIPTFLGAQKSAQDRSAQSDLRNLLTSEVSYYTQNQYYADSTDLGTTDPTYNAKLAAGTIIATAPTGQTLSSSGATVVCLSEKSVSGTMWGIESIATGSGAGTWYFKDTTGGAFSCSATPTASTANPFMSQAASTVGW